MSVVNAIYMHKETNFLQNFMNLTVVFAALWIECLGVLKYAAHKDSIFSIDV